MRIQKIIFMIVCVSLAMPIIDYWGGFSTSDGVNKISADPSPQDTGIVYKDLDTANSGRNISTGGSGIQNTEDLANSYSGWTMVASVISGILGVFIFIMLPYPYLVAHSVPQVFAIAAQGILNLLVTITVLQLWRGFGWETVS